MICLEDIKDSIFYPCGHECVCYTCGREFIKKARDRTCPICREQIKDIVKVFRWYHSSETTAILTLEFKSLNYFLIILIFLIP